MSKNILSVENIKGYSTVELLYSLVNQTNHHSTIIEGLLESGLNDVLDDVLSEMLESGKISNILNSLQAYEIPVRAEGEPDDTKAIQRVVDKGKKVLIVKPLTISDTIVLLKDTEICGMGKDKLGITMVNDDKFMFEYLSPLQDTGYDYVSSIYIHDIRCEGKNIIRINKPNADTFGLQGHHKGIVIERVKFKGIDSLENIETTPPSRLDLTSGGVAIMLTKVFDGAIKDSEIERFGIAVDLFGSDINLIENCRFAYNNRHVHTTRIDTYCSQNKVINCDVMWAKSRGHIYLERSYYDIIENNYFEAYNNEGMFIYGDGCFGTDVHGNRIDTNGIVGLSEILIHPVADVRIHDNVGNGNSTKSPVIEIGEKAYNDYFRDRRAYVYDNVGMTFENHPLANSHNQKGNLFSMTNANTAISGAITSGYGYEKVGGVWKTKAVGNAVISLQLEEYAPKIRLIIKTKSTDTSGTFHMNCWLQHQGGPTVFQSGIPKGCYVFEFNNTVMDNKTVVIEYVPSHCDIDFIKIEPIYPF